MARCPQCGRLDGGASIQPLFVVTGASGSGKTAVSAHLAELLAGRCMTLDVDLLLDAAQSLNGAGTVDWPAFREAWLAVAHGVAQSGMPTVLIGPLIPDHLEGLPGRRWIGEMHFLVLDCSDSLRQTRIEGRPTWRSRDISDQIAFGRWLREHIPDQFDTGTGTPRDTAEALSRWVLDRL